MAASSSATRAVAAFASRQTSWAQPSHASTEGKSLWPAQEQVLIQPAFQGVVRGLHVAVLLRLPDADGPGSCRNARPSAQVVGVEGPGFARWVAGSPGGVLLRLVLGGDLVGRRGGVVGLAEPRDPPSWTRAAGMPRRRASIDSDWHTVIQPQLE